MENRMIKMYGERPTKDVYYLGIAKAVRLRSTCIVRLGAIIVKDDQIVATGYNGSPRGTKSCLEKGFCLRRKMGIPSGSQYELCASVHAEMNDIINSARAGVSLLSGDIYIFGEFDGKIIKALPCSICKRMIINAGIKRVICSIPLQEFHEDPNLFNYKVYDVEDWVKFWQDHDITEDPEVYGKDSCLK
jgi:dCMP deaminase